MLKLQNGATVIQKYVRRYLAKKIIKKRQSQNNSKKVYHRILCREDIYYMIQGFLNISKWLSYNILYHIDQDVKIMIYDIFKKDVTQELNISKREYVLMVNFIISFM